MGGCTSRSAASAAKPVPNTSATEGPKPDEQSNSAPEQVQRGTSREPQQDGPGTGREDRSAPKAQHTKEHQMAKAREAQAQMKDLLNRLEEGRTANKKNLGNGKLDTPWIAKLNGAFPVIKGVAAVVAEVSIPPPGGHCVKLALDIAHQVISELATNQVMMGLAATCIAHMMYFFDERKIMALESDESLCNTLTKFDACVSKIQAFIYSTSGKDSFWLKRLIVLPETQDKLKLFHAELLEIERSLQLGVTVASYAFLQEAHQAQEDVKREVGELLEKYPDCHSVSDLAKNKDAQQELAGIMGGLGEFQEAALASISNVINKQGVHTLVKNKTMQRLWAEKFALLEKVQWRTFWEAFPCYLTQDREELTSFFQDEHNKCIFVKMVDTRDPEHVDVNEINCVFADDTGSLHEKAKAKVDEFIHNQGAENQIAPLLKEIPEDCIRPDRQQLMDVMLEKRLVVVRGLPGEGKFIAACQAGKALFRPPSRDNPEAGHNHFQAIYTADLEGCKSKDAIDNKLISSLKKIPQLGASDDQVQSSLNVLFCMDQRESPYNVLIILNHAEEVQESAPKGLRDEFYARLRGILFHDGKPTNITVALSSRVQLEEMASWGSCAFKDICTDYLIQPLSKAAAAKIFLLELERKRNEREKAEVTQEQAEKLAVDHGLNPEILKLLAGYMNDQDSLEMALESPYKAVQESRFNGVLLACLSKLGKALPTLMLLVEVTPTGFSKDVLKKVLRGWYANAKKDNEVGFYAGQDLNAMMSLNLLNLSGGVYTVVPMIKDYIKYLLENHDATGDPAMDGYISRVLNARFMVFKNFVALALELLETTCELSMHAYSTAYPAMASNKPYVQGALKLVMEHEQLYKDPEVVNKVLQMLSIMEYDRPLYHLEFVQDVCLDLASHYPGDNLIVGTCKGAASAFYALGQDEKYGHKANLERAEESLRTLMNETSERATLARAVALRARGLILRELYDKLDVAIASHKEALQLLRPLADKEIQKAQIETVINLAELSGTLDYIGWQVGYNEGIQTGQEAINQATQVFELGGKPADHPVTALALGALGYNLRNNGNPEAALEVHKKAKEMRLHVCGDKHEATAMSIQQMGLCYKDMGQFEEAEKCLKQSLDIREFLQRTNDLILLIANTLYELASLYKIMGKDDETKVPLAIEFLKKAIEARQSILRRAHKKIQGPCKEIIELLHTQGRQSEAEEYEALLEAE
ncbi:hypothetical protein DUNSADRAFT_12772 [Dunaliella salina]|uniref:Uncharacterized protein n=1 Tax=Dunaliella salina TaxID=3046 RepID=A0ABQ7GAK3_DUNSA|nr:hypothetical protein DUNSADRAFT_12772 [Dunaliella salina]|eukprot:KAF5831644.1 hypothetical protein DUNSADRAFT_12772 [Dunaliella salina]